MDRDTATLTDIQDRLHAHFRSLANTRERIGLPIFALEHGLNPAELEHANALLRARHKARLPLTSHWLLWAVYASEAGYGYAGDEYWPSFEKQTPNWQFHDRPKIKTWFRRFQKSFNGAVPSGPWAQQFSIIAWPITHALLPRYLQLQFARLLYDLRFRLALASLDAGSIGRLLAGHASHASTRFQAFLQQEQLTGQIVAALLRGESVDGDEFIHAPTLTRIVRDLQLVRSSRDWLNETRRVVSDRFTGIGRGTYGVPPTIRPDEPVLPGISSFVVRPNLLLRHSGIGNWSVLLQLKSFRPVAAENTELRAFLASTRCRMNGANDWKPTGWLLSGDRKGTLRRWPDEASPLIQFERRNPLMDHLLESECRLDPGPIWLFRVGSDGIARYIASRTVRPAGDYLVVTGGTMPRELPNSTPCMLQCAGVHASRLAVPDHVSADATARLRDLGLTVARTIRVWPAGLPGRGWDGEGRTEWLTTESPCFGITPDHPVRALSFRLNGNPEQVLATDLQAGPMFVRLPPLRAGLHTLTVEAHRSPDLDHVVATPPAKGFVRLAVREPEPWIPGVAAHSGLIVTAHPYDANLDVFWRNELDLSVNGPEDFGVNFRVNLYAADGRQILSDRVGPAMSLPITPAAWRRTFDRFLNDDSRAWKYLEAASCTLQIEADSLGACALRFDHDPSPLRWALGSRRRQTFVRLVDDTGKHSTAPDLRLYGMERPLNGIRLNAETARIDQTVQPPGGLFLASHPPFVDAAVVSAPPPRVGLQHLGVQPVVEIPGGQSALQEAFRLLSVWHGARQAGFLADVRRRRVTSCIINAIFSRVCGTKWAKAEEAFAQRPTSQDCLDALETLVDRRTKFGTRLRRQTNPGDSETVLAATLFNEAKRHGVSGDGDLCQFALCLAINSSDVLADPLVTTRGILLAHHPALLRGARLMSLLRERYRDRQASALQSRVRP